MYRLIIEDDEGRQSVVPVPRSEITIGRREGNTIRLNERNVSRLHARLIEVQDELFLEDAGSRYGVRVNGQRVLGRILLRPGDDVHIGSYHLSAMKDGSPVVVQRSPIFGDPGQDVPSDPGRRPSFDDASPFSPVSRLRTMPDGDPSTLPRLSPSFAESTEQQAELQDILLWGSRSTIGRTTDNDIAIVHPSVKRRHGLLAFDGEQYRLQAAEGVDNLKVNGQPVRRALLHDGDQVEIGAVPFTFRAPRRPSPTPRPESWVPPPAAADYDQATTLSVIRPRTRWPVVAGLCVAAAGVVALFFVLFAPPLTEEDSLAEPGAPELEAAPLLAEAPAEPAAEPPDRRGALPLGPAAMGAASLGTEATDPGAAGGNGLASPAGGPPPGAAAGEQALDPAEVLSQVRQALGKRDWDAAQSLVEAALKRGASGPQIESLFVRAQEEKRAAAQLARSRELAAQHNIEAAFLAARSVPVTSVYHGEADKLARRLMGKVVDLHLERGKAHLQRGDAAAALEEYQAARALAPKNRRAMRGEKLALAGLGGAETASQSGGPARGAGARNGKPPAGGERAVATGGAAAGTARGAATARTVPVVRPPAEPAHADAPGPLAAADPVAGPSIAGPAGAGVGQAAQEEPRRASTRREEAIQLYQKGRVLYAKGMMNEAEQMMKQAIVLVPRFADPHLILALIFARQQQKELALAEFRQFLLIAPNDPRRPMVEGMMRSISGGR